MDNDIASNTKEITMSDLINEIARKAQNRTAKKREFKQKTYLMDKALDLDVDTGFPFERALAGEGLSLICELRKASPESGPLIGEYSVRDLAQGFETAGATALSVVTEPDYYLGRDEHVTEAAKAVSLPVMKRDFVVDDYMIYEAKLLGADAVNLICSILEPHMLMAYINICNSLGLSAVVEVNSGREMSAALQAGARIICLNQNDIKEFGEAILSGIPKNVLTVSTGGISTPDDIALLKRYKVDAAIIDDPLMKATDKKAFIEGMK